MTAGWSRAYLRPAELITESGPQRSRPLRRRGRLDGWEVDLCAISPAARTVVEEAGWIHPVLHKM